MPSTLDLYKKTTALPQGHRLFSILFSQKAPYFASIHLMVREMRPHYAEIKIPKRRSVQNHIGTVHAIAVCNGLEAAMGLLAEATTPAGPPLAAEGHGGRVPREVDDGPDLHR